MLGYLNNESLRLTLRTNSCSFFTVGLSKEFGKKGEESGNELNVVSIKRGL